MDIQNLAFYLSKAYGIAHEVLRLNKEIELKISQLEDLIFQVERILRKEKDREGRKKINRLIWESKKLRIMANIFLSSEERRKALSYLNKALDYAKKALFYLKEEELSIKDLAHIRPKELSKLISRILKKKELIKDEESKNIILDAQKVEKIAHSYFEREDYKKVLEGVDIAQKLIHKALGIISLTEKEDNFLRLVKRLKRLKDILAKISHRERKEEKIKKYIEKALDLQRRAVISLYLEEDLFQAELEINKGWELASKVLEEKKLKFSPSVINKRLKKAKELIEYIRREIKKYKHKDALKIYSLSEKYFYKALEHFKNKNYESCSQNLETFSILCSKS